MIEQVYIEREGHIAWLVVNRPEKLNTVTKEMGEQLHDLVKEINHDPEIRVVILRGAGDKHFSAGSDIKALDHYGTPWELRNRDDYCVAIRQIRKPVIAMIRGYALGGGLELALNSDIRISSETGQFGCAEVRWGWIGGSGNTQILTRLVGFGKAMELVTTGDYIDAAEAKNIGLVEKLVPDAELEAAAREMAGKIAVKSPIVTQIAKHVIRNCLNVPLEAGLAYENDMFTFCFTTEDSKEGREAFAAKRTPDFQGR